VFFYTGAGISTSAEIPDFRGPSGIWTLQAKGESAKGKEFDEVVPTYAHYAITELLHKGLIKYVISTNMDGLHRRSGLPSEFISELHGNSYREYCDKCEKEYLRGFDVGKTVINYRDHYTGRKCIVQGCGGKLKDDIVHFSENMPKKSFSLAIDHARKCDFALVLGTSMNVQPAASLPDKALRNQNGKFLIVNLQKTPYDKLATWKIYMKTDQFMELLMMELGLDHFDRSTVIQLGEDEEVFQNQHEDKATIACKNQ